MHRLPLLLAAGVFAGCQTALPPVDPQMAWVEFSTSSPGSKLIMADRLDDKRLSDGRFFQVTPGSHELRVRYDFEVFGGGGSLMNGPVERLCYLTIRFDHFEAGQRYVLEGRSLAFTPSARLYNAKREIVAEDLEYNCII